MCRQNHTFAADYFALGVIAFEFMMGRVLLIYIYIYIIATLQWKNEVGDT